MISTWALSLITNTKHRAFTVAAITMVLPVGTSIPDQLRCLSMQIKEVVAHGGHHGAIRALTVAHIYL
jgi:hypothetical protein